MQKLIISGSAKLQDQVNYWLNYFRHNNYEILNCPKPIKPEKFTEELPAVFKDFYAAIEDADIFFLMNEDKNGIKGYIGASAFAELTYAVILNLIHHKNIKIYIQQ